MIYYIYVDDEAGRMVRQALIDAATRGVAVSVIVDGLGSEHAEHNGFFEPLREAGADVCRFVPRWGRRYLLRNHQKLVLADEARAIIGGFNVEDSYFGTPAEQGVARPGAADRGPGGAAHHRLFRRAGPVGEAPQTAAARVAPRAGHLEPARGQDALAVRRPDPPAVALGTGGEARHRGQRHGSI